MMSKPWRLKHTLGLQPIPASSSLHVLCGDNGLIKCFLIFLWTFSLMSPFLPALKKDAKNVTHTTDGSPTSGLFILKADVRVERKVKQDVAGVSYKGGE